MTARYVVSFVMQLKTRTVEFAGITRQPDARAADRMLDFHSFLDQLC